MPWTSACTPVLSRLVRLEGHVPLVTNSVVSPGDGLQWRTRVQAGTRRASPRQAAQDGPGQAIGRRRDADMGEAGEAS
jgi:hypothetical protein